MKFVITVMVCFAVLTNGLIAQNANPPKRDMTVHIDNPKYRRLVAAVPNFFVVDSSDSEAKSIADEYSDYMRDLLVFSGVFNIVAEKAYIDLVKKMLKTAKSESSDFFESQEGSSFPSVKITDWKALGIESVTLTELKKESGSWTVTFKTLDILNSKVLIAKRYRKVTKSEMYKVIRRYAGIILETYTKRKGLFESKIVFVGRKRKKDSKQIYLVDFDGRNLKQITTSKVPHLSPSWSPNGKYVNFTSYKAGKPDIYLYEVATGKMRRASSFKDAASGGSWSPDSASLVFTRSIKANAEIYVLDPFSGKNYPLIRGRGLDVEPAISPDGQFLAFVSGRFKNPHIFRATLSRKSNGRLQVIGEKRLTFAGWYNATPAWSPSSAKIAFAGYDRDIDRFDIFTMDSDGKNLERLTLKAGDNEYPSWSPDGQMMVFHSNRVGQRDVKGPNNLYLMNRDGSGQRKIELNLYEAEAPRWSQ